MPLEKPDTVAELRRVALATLVERGIDGTTVQQVADAAGCAKSNVLYHFGSKQGLVEAALAPAVAALGELVDSLEEAAGRGGTIADPELVALFVETLLDHRLAASLILNRMGELPEGEVLGQLCERKQRLAALISGGTCELGEGLRVGIVLGGVAFALASPMGAPAEAPAEQLRPALIRVAQELLAPVRRIASADPECESEPEPELADAVLEA